MDRKLYKHEDNALGRLNAGISAGTLSIPLQSGNGALFPATANGSATSVGTATALNSTGIQAALSAAGVAAGDIIENVTDGSYAVIVSISTNAIVTTRLKGGSDNLWQDTDVWAVNRFVITLVKYDTDGETVLQREKVLIESRSGDSLTANASGRGFDGSTAASFATSDFVYLFMTSAAVDGLQQAVAQAYLDIDSLISLTQDIAYTDVANVWTGVQTFTPSLLQINDDPVGGNDPVRFSYLASEIVAVEAQITTYLYGDGSDGALTITSGVTTINEAARDVYQYTDVSITGTGALAIGANHQNKTVYILVNGNLTITSSATPAVDADGRGGVGGVRASPAGSYYPGASPSGSSGPVCFASAGNNGTGATPASTSGLNGSGGGGGGGFGNAGADGTLVSGSSAAAGIGGASTFWNSNSPLSRLMDGFCGGGGGTGAVGKSGGGTPTGYGGAGGAGGGSVIFLVRGDINITSTLYARGIAGENGEVAAGTGGGGGGGGGGFIGIFYAGNVTANTATFTVSGGAGGSGGGAGGAGGAGRSAVRKINMPFLG